jgi:hypothetical protein
LVKKIFEVLLFFLVSLQGLEKLDDMGRKKLERQSAESLLDIVSTMLVPEHVLEYFEIWDAREHKDRWVIEMREKEGFIPQKLTQYQDVMFDGYCNPLETLSHSFVCKPVYLRLFRRRYKRSASDEHFSNQYDVSLKGVKMVPELGFFLKEED